MNTPSDILSKIKTREELSVLSATLRAEGKTIRAEGKTIGVTNGAFDILHAGHVTYLENAKNFVMYLSCL